MDNNIILVTGTSGTGKTTVLRELSKQGIATIGIDEEKDLTYWVNSDGTVFTGKTDFDEEFLNNHQWVCDVERLKKILGERSRPVVICGSCDNILECMDLADVTLTLNCPPEIFMERIDQRSDNDYGKSPAAKAALLSYYMQYYKDCEEAGAIPIDATASIDNVVNEVKKFL